MFLCIKRKKIKYKKGGKKREERKAFTLSPQSLPLSLDGNNFLRVPLSLYLSLAHVCTRKGEEEEILPLSILSPPTFFFCAPLPSLLRVCVSTKVRGGREFISSSPLLSCACTCTCMGEEKEIPLPSSCVSPSLHIFSLAWSFPFTVTLLLFLSRVCAHKVKEEEISLLSPFPLSSSLFSPSFFFPSSPSVPPSPLRACTYKGEEKEIYSPSSLLLPLLSLSHSLSWWRMKDVHMGRRISLHLHRKKRKLIFF